MLKCMTGSVMPSRVRVLGAHRVFVGSLALPCQQAQGNCVDMTIGNGNPKERLNNGGWGHSHCLLTAILLSFHL